MEDIIVECIHCGIKNKVQLPYLESNRPICENCSQPILSYTKKQEALKHIQNEKKSLYKKIVAFNIDNKVAELSFANRLCRENDWGMSYTLKCINEYKKFLYLSAISQTSLTPSDEVDQVWHLHLTYTKSYWTELCEKVLERDFHHNPTIGGSKEQTKYETQYQQTLDLYHQVFHKVPDVDIWPTVEDRFKDADKFVRINKAKYQLFERSTKKQTVNDIKKYSPYSPYFPYILYAIFLFFLLYINVYPPFVYDSGYSPYSNLYDVAALFFPLGLIAYFHIIKAKEKAKRRAEEKIEYTPYVDNGGNSTSSRGGGGDSGCGGCGGCGG